jgi:hypothetical protein
MDKNMMLANPLIVEVKDNSDNFLKRLRVSFDNEYALSIIKGRYSYGGPEGLFEIAIIDLKKGGFAPHLFDECDQGDDVLGHCSVECVNHYIEKIANHKREVVDV